MLENVTKCLVWEQVTCTYRWNDNLSKGLVTPASAAVRVVCAWYAWTCKFIHAFFTKIATVISKKKRRMLHDIRCLWWILACAVPACVFSNCFFSIRSAFRRSESASLPPDRRFLMSFSSLFLSKHTTGHVPMIFINLKLPCLRFLFFFRKRV